MLTRRTETGWFVKPLLYFCSWRTSIMQNICFGNELFGCSVQRTIKVSAKINRFSLIVDRWFAVPYFCLLLTKQRFLGLVAHLLFIEQERKFSTFTEHFDLFTEQWTKTKFEQPVLESRVARTTNNVCSAVASGHCFVFAEQLNDELSLSNVHWTTENYCLLVNC